MELWVRNQTKTGLYKIDNIYIHEDEDKTIHIWADGINKYLKYYLGGYKSKERALEILDEIQNFMLCNKEYKYTTIASINELGGCYIYQMPSE